MVSTLHVHVDIRDNLKLFCIYNVPHTLPCLSQISVKLLQVKAQMHCISLHMGADNTLTIPKSEPPELGWLGGGATFSSLPPAGNSSPLAVRSQCPALPGRLTQFLDTQQHPKADDAN